ncbi:MAG: hypothetical protein AAF660_14785 [Pseudomonadota bacterium]
MASSTTNYVFVLTGPIGLGRLDERSRQRLRHARLAAGSGLVSPAARLLKTLGADADLLSRAATRYREDADKLADVWVAAADPVYLEPRLDHLCLMAQAVDADERTALVDHLNDHLGGDGWSFVVAGSGIYLLADAPFATSAYPTSLIDGLLPNQYLPAGDGADDFRRRLAEIEMCLHEHPLNDRRQQRGARVVNSLWLWGGGTALMPEPKSLPVLCSDDSLLRGLWTLYGAEARGRLDSPPADGAACVLDIGDELQAISRLLDTDRPVMLFSRDGMTIDASGAGRWRFWSRRHVELEPPA